MSCETLRRTKISLHSYIRLLLANFGCMNGYSGGLSSGFQRMLTGQNFFISDYTYHGPTGTKGTVALGTEFPSKIMRLSIPEYGGKLICQKGALLAASHNVEIQMEFTKNFASGFFGGEGFVLQGLTGDGEVFLKAGGTLIRHDLDDGEQLRISSGCLVGFSDGVEYGMLSWRVSIWCYRCSSYHLKKRIGCTISSSFFVHLASSVLISDVQMMKGFANVFAGGEGLFITTLRGPGVVWLQGQPPQRMVSEIARRVPSGGGLGLAVPIGGGGGGEGGESGGGEEAT